MNDEKNKCSEKKSTTNIPSSSDTDEDVIYDSKSKLESPLKQSSEYHPSEEFLSEENSKTKHTNPTPTYSPKKQLMSRWEEQQNAESSIAEGQNETIETKTNISNLDSGSTEIECNIETKYTKLQICENQEKYPYCEDIQKEYSDKSQEQTSCSKFSEIQKQDNSRSKTENTDTIFASTHDPNKECSPNSSKITNTVRESRGNAEVSENKKSSFNISHYDVPNSDREDNVVADSVIQQIRESVIRHTDEYFDTAKFEKKENNSLLISEDDLATTEPSVLELSTSEKDGNGFIHVDTLKPNQDDLSNISNPVHVAHKLESDKTKDLEKGNKSVCMFQEVCAVPGPSRLPSCSVCCQEFDDQYLLNQHYAHHHLRRESSSSDDCEDRSKDKLSPTKRLVLVDLEESEHKSGDCKNASFFENSKVHYQSQSEEKRFTCERCGNTFPSAESCKIHEKECETSEDLLHKCDKCLKKFKTKSRLDGHYLIHTGEKRFSCQLCGKRFNKKCNRNKHKKVCETITNRDHKCPKCPRSFLRKCDLTKHLRNHLKDKPHSCEKCGIRFRDMRNLNSHRKTCRASVTRE